MNSGTVNRYETMPMDHRVALGDIIRDITYADGSILFIWIPTTLQSGALNVLRIRLQKFEVTENFHFLIELEKLWLNWQYNLV